MELYDLVMPLGIITYILIILAILTGRRIIKLHPKWHKIIAGLTILFATVHAAIVVYYNV